MSIHYVIVASWSRGVVETLGVYSSVHVHVLYNNI